MSFKAAIQSPKTTVSRTSITRLYPIGYDLARLITFSAPS